jgi:aryl-alcohol dehydrogenase-like predicted oxidoreductase
MHFRMRWPRASLGSGEAPSISINTTFLPVVSRSRPYRPGDRAQGVRRFDRSFRKDGLERLQPVVALLREVGERYSKTPAQVALRWLIEQESVLPIPGAKNGRQAAGNAQALSFSLVDGEIEALGQATTAWRS